MSQERQRAFLAAVAEMVDDLKRKRGFRKGLRVKGVTGVPGVFEMTWADDGRGTFEYGESLVAGEAHIVWRRVGTHAILKHP